MSDQVLFGDLAARLGSAARAVALLDRVRGDVTEDPIGRPVVSAEAARAAIEADALEQRIELALAAEHRAWAADRQARRSALAKQAHDEAFARAYANQREMTRQINAGEIPSGWVWMPEAPAGLDVQSAARRAAHEALSDFDAKEPELDFWTWRESKAGRRCRKRLAKAGV